MTWRGIVAAAALLLLAGPAHCQELQLAHLGDVKLQNGQTIKECRLGYRTFGKLNEQKSNAVLFPTWFTGTSGDLAGQIGPGKVVDSSHYFVIAVDALGNGVSSSPSNSKHQPGREFPHFTIGDMVETEYRLVSEKLGLKHLHAVLGISMGGMQTFEWMVAHPEFMDYAVPIVGSPRQTAQDMLLWKSQLRPIQRSQSPEEAKRAMQAIAGIHALHLRTPQYHVASTKPESVDELLDIQERSVLAHDPHDWASQLVAMLDQDIYRRFGGSPERAAGSVRAKCLIIVSLTDHMVNPTPALELGKLLKARIVELSSNAGHLAPGAEGAKVNTAVTEFLAR
jgi:homoserine O-acetyltransferase